MFGIGAGEFVLILIVGLIVFGPSKLPEFGRSLGKLLREFRKAQAALSTTINDLDEPAKPAATPSTPHAAPSTSSVAPSTSTTPSTTPTTNVAPTSQSTATLSLDKATQATQHSTTNSAQEQVTTRPSEVMQDAPKAPNTTTAELTKMIESNPIRVDSNNLLAKENGSQ